MPSVTLDFIDFLLNFPYFTHLSDLLTYLSNLFKINLTDCQLLITYFKCKRLQYLHIKKTFYNICSNKTNTLKNFNQL